MKTFNYFIPCISMLALFSCKNSNDNYDASGTFEATEVVVSAEANGKIMELNLEEGDELKVNQQVGYIDSVQLFLKKKQLAYSIRATESRRPEIKKQIAVYEQQIATQKIEKARIERLLKANAANQKQLDDINNQILFLQKQLNATNSSLSISNKGITEDAATLDVQIAQLNDQLQKCKIVNPINGTVLVKYVEQDELATQGKPLYTIADIKNMILRAYVSSSQLSQVKIGQQVNVFVDYGKDGSKEYKGKITWISSKSEFTPKTIQTKDERANTVYTVKIAVKNDGYIKIGMYGDVKI